MKIQLSYDSKENLPKGFESLYTENEDGTFSLTGIDGMKSQKDIDAQLEANRKERTEHGKTKEKLKELEKKWKGLEPDEVKEKLDRFEELELAAEGKLDETKINQMVEARVKSKITPLERKIQELESEAQEKESTIGEFKQKDIRRKIEDSVREAAVKAKVLDTAVEDVLLLSQNVFEVTEDGRVVVKENSGYAPGLDPNLFLKDIQEKRPHWWPNSSGGGAKGSGGSGIQGKDNPWSNEGWNLTRQGQLLRESPAQAEKLAKLAGTTVSGGKRPVAK